MNKNNNQRIHLKYIHRKHKRIKGKKEGLEFQVIIF